MATTKSGKDWKDNGAAWWRDKHDLYIDEDGNVQRKTTNSSSNPLIRSTSAGKSPLSAQKGMSPLSVRQGSFNLPTQYSPSNSSVQENIGTKLTIPAEKMTSLTEKNIADALDYYIKNISSVQDGKISREKFDQELINIMGSTNSGQKLAYIDRIIDVNSDVLGFDSTGDSSKYQEVLDADGNPTGKYQYIGDTEDTTNGSGLDYYEELINENLMTDVNSDRAQQYRQNMLGSINSYEQASNASLASAELDAYKMLGQQQLQLESQIAEARMQALKSGTTSAQLASQQLANMFAAQSAAQQTASAVAQQRASMADQYNQQRASVESDLYSLVNNNALTAANAYAQLGAAQASYNSYIQQPYAQYKAMLQSYGDNPDSFLKAMGLKE